MTCLVIWAKTEVYLDFRMLKSGQEACWVGWTVEGRERLSWKVIGLGFREDGFTFSISCYTIGDGFSP